MVVELLIEPLLYSRIDKGIPLANTDKNSGCQQVYFTAGQTNIRQDEIVIAMQRNAGSRASSVVWGCVCKSKA